MIRQRRGTPLLAPGAVLLALLGIWLGHTVEYARVWGPAGLGAELQGPIHGYMLPLAGLLIGLSAIFGVALRTVWLRLGRRMDQARADLFALWRGRHPDPVQEPSAEPASATARFVALWLPLAVLQVALYLIQENVEAYVAGVQTPGLGPITGIHWAASLIQVGIAFVLAAGVTLVGRLFTRNEALVQRVQALVRALSQRRRRPLASPRPTQPSTATPLYLLGGHLWRRPPPAILFG